MSIIDKRDLALLHEKIPESQLAGAIKRYQNGEPLAYIIGEWYFYGLTFKLNRDCLIPRPDTEHVVDKAVELIPKNGNFIDLCTGSGCIAISVKKHRPDLDAHALDISAEALEMAKLNAVENGTEVAFTQADVMKTPPAGEIGKRRQPNGAPAQSDDMNSCEKIQNLFVEATVGRPLDKFPLFDAVISNPPYIKTEILQTLDVAKTEPLRALDGGKDGLDFYRHIIKAYAPALKPSGMFIFEIGYDQSAELHALAEQNGFECTVYKDYGGNDRVAVLKKPL